MNIQARIWASVTEMNGDYFSPSIDIWLCADERRWRELEALINTSEFWL